VKRVKRVNRVNRSVDRSDLVSLADRLGALQLVRLGLAVVVLTVAHDPHELGLTAHTVAPITAVYLLVTVATEAFRRLFGLRGLGLASAMLLVDGVYLAAVLAPVGGPRSILISLVYIHLIAVTLLTSWRTGLKLAVWHALLMVAGYAAEVDGIAPRLLGLDAGLAAPPREVVAGATAFWVVALCTAMFANLSERELRRGKVELAALARMASSFEAGAAAGDVGCLLLEHVVEVFGFARAVIVTPSSAGGWALRSTARRGGGAVTVETATLPAGEIGDDEVVARCWAQRSALLARHLPASANPMLAELLPGAANVIVVPLLGEDPLAVLVVEHGGRVGAVIPRATVAGVSSFAAHAALALRTAALVAEIDRLASTDPLTGLANRRVFEAALNREVARAARSGAPLSLLVLDVDHFKRVNDLLGHQAGDDVLRHVGRALGGEARQTDLAARYGGEEFCVVLPDCGPAEAMVVADRLRAAIAASTEPTQVSASAGVATMPANAVDGASLVAAADEALYAAKRQGRNRTCHSTRRGGVRLSA
jgi:diguanylate cyclase (GGDEF)-like protein